MPKGSTDCGNGGSCESGKICVKGGCLSIVSSRVCTDLKTYCEEGYECRAGNKCVSPEAEKAKEAEEYLDTGKRHYEEKKYQEASEAFKKAADGFESANQSENELAARDNQFRALCRVAMERDRADAAALREIAEEGHCDWTQKEASDLERMADSIERKRKESDHPASAPSPRRGPSDSSSGVKDAAHCIDIRNIKNSDYKVKNTCTFGVTVKLKTMMNWPKETETTSYSLSSGNDVTTVSYFGFKPVVVSACGKGSVCR